MDVFSGLLYLIEGLVGLAFWVAIGVTIVQIVKKRKSRK